MKTDQHGEAWIWIATIGAMKVTGHPQGHHYPRVPAQVQGAYILVTQTRWRPREPRATRCLVPATTRVWSQLQRRYNERAMGRLNLRSRVHLGELGAAMWAPTSDRMVQPRGRRPATPRRATTTATTPQTATTVRTTTVRVGCLVDPRRRRKGRYLGRVRPIGRPPLLEPP